MNLIILCAEIKIYYAAYPLPSLNIHLWSVHNRLRYIFYNLRSIRANWKVVGRNVFEKLKIDGNLVVKIKVLPRSGSIALRQLNPAHKKGEWSLKKTKKQKKKTHEIKPTLKNESKEWIWTRRDLYIIYLQINKLLQKTLEIVYTCTCVSYRYVSWDNSSTNSKGYVIEISNLNYTFLLLKVTYFFSCNDLGTPF